MKNIKLIFTVIFLIGFCAINAQEKKIKFNKGTLRICSSKQFQIEGYDGDEVVIKSLHEKREENSPWVVSGFSSNAPGQSYSYSSSSNGKLAKVGTTSKSNKEKTKNKKGPWEVVPVVNFIEYSDVNTDSVRNNRAVFFSNDSERRKGLKKIGKKNQNSDLGIYFTIEQKEGELLFKDQNQVGFIMTSNESYAIKIPNSLKLIWSTNNCVERDRTGEYRFSTASKPSSLQNFNGEVEISSTVNNMKLVDVTGPVVLNTIGGNVTVEFDKKYPSSLYSIYTNNGFIDIQIPKESNLLIDVIGRSVFSDVDFKVLEEEEVKDVWQTTNKMKLKYGTGKVKMKLNGGFGNVYLRKK